MARNDRPSQHFGNKSLFSMSNEGSVLADKPQYMPRNFGSGVFQATVPAASRVRLARRPHHIQMKSNRRAPPLINVGRDVEARVFFGKMLSGDCVAIRCEHVFGFSFPMFYHLPDNRV